MYVRVRKGRNLINFVYFFLLIILPILDNFLTFALSGINFPPDWLHMKNLKDLSVGSLFRYHVSDSYGLSQRVFCLVKQGRVRSYVRCVGFFNPDGSFSFVSPRGAYFYYSNFEKRIVLLYENS